MARKKKKDIVDDVLDGIFLEDKDRLEMLYLESLAVNVDLSIRVLDLEKTIQALQTELIASKARENDLLRKDKIKELKDRKNKHVVLLKNKTEEINNKLSIDLAKCTFDDETGKITLLDD